MNVIGEKVYVSRLDTIKLANFLREQGMSEQDIGKLTVEFLHRIPGFWSRQDVGCYHSRTHTISLATWRNSGRFSSFTRTAQKEILTEFNETLMHEIQHALDKRKSNAHWFSLLLNCMFLVVPLALDWFFLRGTLWFWLPFFVIVILGPRLAYQYSLFERRARAFEKKYGRTYLLFRT